MTSTETVPAVLFPSHVEAKLHGKGGFWYRWKAGSRGNWPQDVYSLFIAMPVDWGGTEFCEAIT